MALQQIANTDISSTGTFALGSVSSSALTSGRVTFATAGGLLTDSSTLTYDGTTLTSTKFAGALNGTVGATTPSTVVATSVTNSGLTSGRVTYAGASGLLSDSSNLTFNGTTLTANTIGAYTLSGTIAGGGNQINNVIIGNSTPLAGSFTSVNATSITNSGLTSGRVIFANTSGLLSDSSTLTYDGTTLTTPRLALGGTTLPSAGTATLFLRSSDNSTYLQTGSGNNIYFLDGSQNTMLSLTPTSLAFQISNAAKLTLNSTTLHTANGVNLSVGHTSTGGATFGVASGGNEIFQVFAAFSSNLNLVQNYNYASSVYVANENRASLYSWKIGTTEAMRIDTSGNLGIGTSIPGTYGKVAISVTGTATPTTQANVGPASINLFNGGGGGTTNSTMGIFGWHAGEPGLGSGIGFSRDSSGDWAASIRFYTHPSETSNIGVITERMRITGDGNVGIGTSSPQDMLDVSGNARVGQGQIASNATVGSLGIYSGLTYDAGNAQLRFFGKSVDNTGLTYEIGRISSGSAYGTYTIDGGLFFFTATNNGSNVLTLTEKMRINNLGNVGIGTNRPAVKLQVSDQTGGSFSSAGSAGSLSVCKPIEGANASTDFTRMIDLYAYYPNYTNANPSASISAGVNYNGTQDGKLIFSTLRSNTVTEAMRINNIGDVLIGTPDNTTNGGFIFSPGYNGTGISAAIFGHSSAGQTNHQYMIFNYNGTGIGSITQSGTTAVLYNTTSDQRLKENIVNAPAGNIDNIKIRSFDWIADGSHQEYGMVAQELLEVAPYAVYQPQKPEEMMAVDYSKLVPMMIKEIQDLKSLIESMATKLKDAGVAGF